MTQATWLVGISGNWDDNFNWSESPNNDTVFIGASGTYTVTLSSPVSVGSLTVDAPHATLFETVAGSLSIGGNLDIEAGTVVLRSANAIGGAALLNGGSLEFANSDALGAATLTVTAGELLGTITETLADTLDLENEN